jgi:hypothetical protein
VRNLSQSNSTRGDLGHVNKYQYKVRADGTTFHGNYIPLQKIFDPCGRTSSRRRARRLSLSDIGPTADDLRVSTASGGEGGAICKSFAKASLATARGTDSSASYTDLTAD